MPPNDSLLISRSGTLPSEYTTINSGVTALHRPVRPASTQTLEDIFNMYSKCVEEQPNRRPVAMSAKPDLKLAVHQGAAPQAEIATPRAVSTTVSFHCCIRSPDVQNSPDVIVTPPPYQFASAALPQKLGRLVSADGRLDDVEAIGRSAVISAGVSSRSRSRFQPPPTRKPMDEWACHYTYRACAFLAARKLSNVLRSPSIELIALLEPEPFFWTDPADPVLSWVRQFQGVTIYTSPTPCSVPHLVITQPTPDDDGSAAWNNVPPPQDPANGNLLSLLFQPRALRHCSDADEDWYSSWSEDSGSEFIDELDFTFDGDDYELPSPDRAETPAPVTPPPYSLGSWAAKSTPMLNVLFAKEYRGEEESMLSPTGGPRVPMVLIQGDESPSSSEFPSSIELDALLSPDGFSSWMTGRVVL